METGFRILMGGVVFALANLRLGEFNLLPDWLGYTLIGMAAYWLAPYAARFGRAIAVALVIVLFVVADFFVTEGVGQAVLAGAIGLLRIALIWTVLDGLVQFAAERERPDLARHASIYRWVYLGLGLTVAVFVQIAFVEPEAAGAFVTFFAVVTLVFLAAVLRLIWAVRHDLTADAAVI
jgi:uncharacterized membrane protein